MTEIVVLFAEKWHSTPFDVLKKDTDDFILIANYLVKLGKGSESTESTTTPTVKLGKQKDGRIRVNDATATGGWF